MVCPNQRAKFALYNSYAMNLNRRNKNCYNCKDFRHLARNCSNRGTRNKIRESRRLKYRNRNNRQILIIKEGNGQKFIIRSIERE